MKQMKIAARIVFVLTVTVCLMAFCATTALAEDDIRGGRWGDLSWELNRTTGELVISGTGKMGNFSTYDSSAWRNYKNDIKSVTVMEGVKNVSEAAFAGCKNLTHVTLPESVTAIDTDAFWLCKQLMEIRLSKKLEEIDGMAFAYCESLTSLAIPRSVKTVGKDAFFACQGLLEKEGGVFYVDTWAVDSDEMLTSVVIREGTLGLCDSLFHSRPLTDVTIPNSVKYIGRAAFYYCEDLTSIELPDGLTELTYYVFERCLSLETVTVPYTIQKIEPSALDRCPRLNLLFNGCEARWMQVEKTIPEEVTVTVVDHDYRTCVSHDENAHKRYCIYCSEFLLELHAWNEGELTASPTHTSKGVRTYLCMGCAQARTESVAKLYEHEWEIWIPHDEKQHKRVCACGEIAYADHHSENGNGCPDCGAAEQDLAPDLRSPKPKREDDPFGCVAAGISPVAFALPFLSALALVVKKRRGGF